MYTLLFLDTETTATTPQNGEIIEIAGILASFDPVTCHIKVVSVFETLVRPQYEISEHITRLTGIDSSMTATAPTIHKAQQLWLDWIDTHTKKVDAVVGHSVDFDISFLQFYHWFVPSEHVIDTLDLAKIWAADASAVNLEFLNHHLNLETRGAHLFAAIVQNKAHRALYDTALCAALFEYVSQQSLTNIASAWHQQLVDACFAPLTIARYVSPVVFEQAEPPSIHQIKLWKNELKPVPFGDQLALLRTQYITSAEYANDLQSLFENIELGRDTRRVVLALIWAVGHSKSKVFFHAHGQRDYWWLRLIMAQTLPPIVFGTVQTAPLEELLLVQRQISLDQINTNQFSTILELLGEVLAVHADVVTDSKSLVQQLDFLAFYVHRGASGQYLRVDIGSFAPETQQILARLKTIGVTSNSLVAKLSSISSTNILGTQLINEFLQGDRVLQSILKSRIIDLNPFDGGVFVECQNAAKFANTVNDVLVDKPVIPTFLTSVEVEQLLRVLKLTEVVDKSKIRYYLKNHENINIRIKSEDDSSDLPKDDKAYFIEPVARSVYEWRDVVEQQKATQSLFLLSTNRVVRDVEEYMTGNWGDSEYLLFGEHGSITKIISKIKSGFVGPVFIRLKDWNALVNADLVSRYNQFFLLDLPPISIPAQLFLPHKVGDAGVVYAHRNLAARALAGQIAFYRQQPLNILS